MSIYDEDWGDVPHTVSRTEQQQAGLIRATPYVPARGGGELTVHEQGLLSSAVHAAGEMISHRQMGHLARSDDTAVTHAVGSIVASLPFVLVAALITGGLFLFASLILEGDARYYVVLWMVVWGGVSLHYLLKNRQAGLDHSAGGIARYEIDSREEIAKYVIDKHVQLIQERWNRGR